MKLFAALLLLLPSHAILQAASQSPKAPVVPKWTRFEHAFKSSIAYSNPLQQASLQVTFISPTGKTNRVDGFWDGGRTWRVRFAPDQVGRWSYQTSCSDVSNRRLHDQRGALICTAPIAGTVFQRHGPIRIARDRRRIEAGLGRPRWRLREYPREQKCIYHLPTLSIRPSRSDLEPRTSDLGPRQ